MGVPPSQRSEVDKDMFSFIVRGEGQLWGGGYAPFKMLDKDPCEAKCTLAFSVWRKDSLGGETARVHNKTQLHRKPILEF